MSPRPRFAATYRTASIGFTRDVNRAAVLRLIASAAPIARKSIAERLGLSAATVTQITRELLEQGLIRVAERAPSRGGRPALLLELVGDAATAVGVKIAADHLVGVSVDLEGEVLDRFECEFDATAEDALHRLPDVLDGWLQRSDGHPPLLGLGVGVPGVFDRGSGTLGSPLLGWRDVKIAQLLQRRLRTPVFVDNDVNTLAIWERLYGRGRDLDDFIVVTVGRGVGLGIVAGGDIYRGFGGGAGEFGHVTIADDGPPCTCGRRGCLEALVGDPALVRQARDAGVLSRRQDVGRLRKLAASGDSRALAIYATAGSILGRTVSGLVNVLAPGLVLVSGEGTQAWGLLESEFERELRAHLFPAFESVVVEVDPWDDAKWARGAAALVLRSTLVPALEDDPGDRSIRARLRRAQSGAVAV